MGEITLRTPKWGEAFSLGYCAYKNRIGAGPARLKRDRQEGPDTEGQEILETWVFSIWVFLYTSSFVLD
jgi:hypothetical protein